MLIFAAMILDSARMTTLWARCGKLSLTFLLLILGLQVYCVTPLLDPAAFRKLTNAERYRWLHTHPFVDLDSAQLLESFNQTLPILSEEKDRHGLLVWSYYKFLTRDKQKLRYEEIIQLLEDEE